MILATTYFVIYSVEDLDFNERRKQNAEIVAQKIIKIYEINPKKINTLEKSIKRKSANFLSLKRQLGLERPIKITNDDELIFQFRPKGLQKGNNTSFEVVSDNGNTYTVTILLKATPRFFLTAIERLKTVQFILMLIASALVSLILSWSIIRPLKKLGKISRNYANSDMSLSIGEDLLFRGDEIGDLSRDFNFMIKEVEKNIQSQTRLMHDVSHELRAPLARIQAAVGLIDQKNTNEVRLVGQMNRECERIDQFIQSILEFSRIDKKDYKLSRIDMSETIRNQLENLKLEFPNKKTEYFETENMPIFIDGYEELVESAIENILRNACKYTPENTPIDIHLHQRKDSIEISIRDYGPGVLSYEKEKLLQPFFRSGNKMHTDGFGLGLSIVQKAMAQHRGELNLNNHPKGGLIVVLRFNKGVDK